MATPTVPLDALGDALRRDLDHPDPRSAAFSARDAYARVAPAPTQFGAHRRWDVGYTPGVATIGVGTATELLMQCLAHVADQGGGEVTLWRQGAVADDDRAARAAGLERDRELLQMRVGLPLDEHPAPSEPLEAHADAPDAHGPDGRGPDAATADGPPTDPAPLPDGVTLRDLHPGRDDQAWVNVNNAAFAGHPEQGAWTTELFAARRREPWFDAHWFLVAERDGSMVGFNWLRRHRPEGRDPEMGEIFVVGVHPAEQGTGLGRALVRAGLQRITDAGVRTGLLYVAADNDAALALYRAVGFEVTRTDRAYTAIVVPA